MSRILFILTLLATFTTHDYAQATKKGWCIKAKAVESCEKGSAHGKALHKWAVRAQTACKGVPQDKWKGKLVCCKASWAAILKCAYKSGNTAWRKKLIALTKATQLVGMEKKKQPSAHKVVVRKAPARGRSIIKRCGKYQALDVNDCYCKRGYLTDKTQPTLTCVKTCPAGTKKEGRSCLAICQSGEVFRGGKCVKKYVKPARRRRMSPVRRPANRIKPCPYGQRREQPTEQCQCDISKRYYSLSWIDTNAVHCAQKRPYGARYDSLSETWECRSQFVPGPNNARYCVPQRCGKRQRRVKKGPNKGKCYTPRRRRRARRSRRRSRGKCPRGQKRDSKDGRCKAPEWITPVRRQQVAKGHSSARMTSVKLCPTGLAWNSSKTKCVQKKPKPASRRLAPPPRLRPVSLPTRGNTHKCPKGKLWDSFMDKCTSSSAQAAKTKACPRQKSCPICPVCDSSDTSRKDRPKSHREVRLTGGYHFRSFGLGNMHGMSLRLSVGALALLGGTFGFDVGGGVTFQPATNNKAKVTAHQGFVSGGLHLRWKRKFSGHSLQPFAHLHYFYQDDGTDYAKNERFYGSAHGVEAGVGIGFQPNIIPILLELRLGLLVGGHTKTGFTWGFHGAFSLGWVF